MKRNYKFKASYQKSGDNYLPVIIHEDGKKEVLQGDPLATMATAKRYAQYEIVDRCQWLIRKQTCNVAI